MSIQVRPTYERCPKCKELVSEGQRLHHHKYCLEK